MYLYKNTNPKLNHQNLNPRASTDSLGAHTLNPKPSSPWTPSARRKGPLPELKISVNKAVHLPQTHHKDVTGGTGGKWGGGVRTELALQVEGGVYCRLRLSQETWSTPLGHVSAVRERKRESE